MYEKDRERERKKDDEQERDEDEEGKGGERWWISFSLVVGRPPNSPRTRTCHCTPVLLLPFQGRNIFHQGGRGVGCGNAAEEDFEQIEI